MLNRLTTASGDDVGLYFQLSTSPSLTYNQFGAIKGIRSGGMAFYDGGHTGTLQETMRLYNGNVSIGTTDPLGYKLYVSGTGHYTSNLSVGGTMELQCNTTLSGTLGVTVATTLSAACNNTVQVTFGVQPAVVIPVELMEH